MNTEKNRKEDFLKTGQYMGENELVTEIITSYIIAVSLKVGREGV